MLTMIMMMSNFLCCKPKHLSLKKGALSVLSEKSIGCFSLEKKKDSDFVYSAEFLAWNWWNIYDFFCQIKVLKTQWMGISGIFRVAASRKRPSATAERDQELFFRGKNGFEKRSWTLRWSRVSKILLPLKNLSRPPEV